MELALLSSGPRGPIPLHWRGGRREAVGVVAFRRFPRRAGQMHDGSASCTRPFNTISHIRENKMYVQRNKRNNWRMCLLSL